jgi:hypothetical protein
VFNFALRFSILVTLGTRDKLGVITRALFLQRDFSETAILVDFYLGLEKSLRSQLTESGFYMGSFRYSLGHTHLTTIVIFQAPACKKTNNRL